jgi:hypothetical protein
VKKNPQANPAPSPLIVRMHRSQGVISRVHEELFWE